MYENGSKMRLIVLFVLLLATVQVGVCSHNGIDRRCYCWSRRHCYHADHD